MKILLCFCVEVLDVMMKLQIGTLFSVLLSLFRKLIGTCKLKNGDLWDGMGLGTGVAKWGPIGTPLFMK